MKTESPMVPHHARLIACLASLSLVLVGCSTTHIVDPKLSRQALIHRIDVGDQVQFKTPSGELRFIDVSGVSETHIEAGDERFDIAEIEVLSIRNYDELQKGLSNAFLGVVVPVAFFALGFLLVYIPTRALQPSVR